MSRLIQRKAITDAFLEILRESERQVGDAEMPRDGVAGWIGQPNEPGTYFIPYSVVTPMAGPTGTGPLTEPGEDAFFSYAVTSFGVSRTQCEDQADLMRLHAGLARKVEVIQWAGTPHEYGRRIQTVVIQGYGPIQRMGDADPKIYGQTDTLSLWTTG